MFITTIIVPSVCRRKSVHLVAFLSPCVLCIVWGYLLDGSACLCVFLCLSLCVSLPVSVCFSACLCVFLCLCCVDLMAPCGLMECAYT